MKNKLFEVGMVVNNLKVKSVDEFDNGFRREPSNRIHLEDDSGNKYIWETSSKKIPQIGDIIDSMEVKYIEYYSERVFLRIPKKR